VRFSTAELTFLLCRDEKEYRRLFCRLSRIKSVLSVVKKPSHCLADEGSNSLRFSNSKVKSHHRFYGFYRLKHIKSVTSVLSAVKKTPLCLADERSNSLRFSNTKIKKPQLQKQSSKAFDFEITVFKFYKLDLRVSNKISYLLLNLLCAFRY
jgi:hypothetical protein